MRKIKNDPAFSEMKTILRKLQRLGLTNDSATRDGESATDGWVLRPSKPTLGPTGLEVFARKSRSLTQWGNRSRFKLALLGGGLIVAVAGIVVIARLYREEPPRPPHATQAKAEPGIDAMTEARRLLALGDVRTAREHIKNARPQLNPQLAFLLAQTYDPTYLSSLPRANVSADVSEAERWYETWYELERQTNPEIDSTKLKRVLSSMKEQRPK